MGVGFANLALGLIAVFRFDLARKGEFQFVATREIVAGPQISYAVGVDGLGLIMMLLAVIVSACAFWMMPKKETVHPKLYHACVLLISGGALGAFCCTDVFFLYAFHELALIPTFLMIGMFGPRLTKAEAAWRATIYLAIGSMILLFGLLYLHVQTGSKSFALASYAELAKKLSPETQKWIFLPLLVGFGTLVSLFPFHAWAGPAYANSPAPVAMLHAGVLKKFGLYGLLRFTQILPAGFEAWRDLLLVLLLGNVLFMGFCTLAQSELHEMLGASSVMHMGYIFLGIVANNAIGYTGAVILMFAHGISIALLFALCGIILGRGVNSGLMGWGGLARQAPILGYLFGFGAFAAIGLPGFANFAGEIMVFFGGFQSLGKSATKLGFMQIATILCIWGVVISAVYMLRAYRGVFFGKLLIDKKEDYYDLAINLRIPLAFLAAVLLIVGCCPKLLIQYIPLPF